MDTEIKNAVKAADKEAQYDEKAKRLLGHKYILAYILIKTVDEFKGMNPRDAVQYIEGDPLIGMIPVEPGVTKRFTAINGFSGAYAQIWLSAKSCKVLKIF